MKYIDQWHCHQWNISPNSPMQKAKRNTSMQIHLFSISLLFFCRLQHILPHISQVIKQLMETPIIGEIRLRRTM